MLACGLIPETTTSTAGSTSPRIARATQSDGAPSVVRAGKSAPISVGQTRKGRCIVLTWPEADQLRSGARTVTEPIARRARANARSPGADTPSSLVTKMCGGRASMTDGLYRAAGSVESKPAAVRLQDQPCAIAGLLLYCALSWPNWAPWTGRSPMKFRPSPLAYLSLVTVTLFATTLACGPTGDRKSTTGEEPAAGEAVSSLDGVQSATIQIEAQGTFIDPEVGQISTPAGRGSGFIIAPSGIAVTNNHVVPGAALLKVYVAGEPQARNATILGVSECSDLAVIDIEGDGFPYLEWFDGEIGTGLPIYVAGFPLGDPEYTLLEGIVAKARANGETRWASDDYVIEHTADTNPGNSGGPVITEDGKVVGIHYAGQADTRQAWAISRDEAQPVVEQLRDGKDVDSIGVNGEVVMSDDGSLFGVWVSAVTSGSPADEAGVQGGDIITALEGLYVGSDGTMADYCDVLRSHEASDKLAIEVLRFSTGEVLGGQLNGDPLVTSFSFSNEVAPDPGTAAEGETYTDYVAVQDDYGAIQMEVPSG